jgi:hypothetical protein
VVCADDEELPPLITTDVDESAGCGLDEEMEEDVDVVVVAGASERGMARKTAGESESSTGDRVVSESWLRWRS